jgi:hypothetical protein
MTCRGLGAAGGIRERTTHVDFTRSGARAGTEWKECREQGIFHERQ